jgi:hypothetical protein
MATYSFDMKNHHDLFKKLDAEFADLTNDSLSSRHAMNFALTAYHMLDWVREHELHFKEKSDEDQKFRKAVYNKCPAMKVMKDLTNGSKHVNITQYVPKVKDTKVHDGTFQDDAFQSSAFDVSALLVNMTDGTVHKFTDVAKSTMDFWAQAFSDGFKI